MCTEKNVAFLTQKLLKIYIDLLNGGVKDKSSQELVLKKIYQSQHLPCFFFIKTTEYHNKRNAMQC